jgi:two-component system OmpR family sensor kinase
VSGPLHRLRAGAAKLHPNDRVQHVSLRDRLVAILVVLALVALAVTAAFAVALLRGELITKVDAQLQATRGALLTDPFTDQDAPQTRGVPSATYAVFLADSGVVAEVGRRTGTDSPQLAGITPAAAAATAGAPRYVAAESGTGRWRVVAVRVTSAQLGVGTLVVGQSLSDVDDTVARMQTILLVVGVAVLAAVALLGWFVVRRALRPLRQVEDVAEAIAAGDLSQRVPEHPTSTEVGRLSSSLNAMLAQIEQAFAVRAASEDRMRRFVSDASHELRTPLAAVRGYAELYRQGAVREPEDVAGAMLRIEHEAARMGGLVEDLLTLARLDEQRLERRSPVDLTVLAADAVQDARALDGSREVTLVGRDGRIASVVVLGDEPRLRQVVTNLLANAVRHTPPGSPIELAVGADGPHGLLEVRDHGEGVPADQVRQVFERFFRADASRQRRSGGSGLGLAIVAAIVGGHGGQVGVTRTAGGGATFVVRLPLTDPGSDVGEAPEIADSEVLLSDAVDHPVS